MIEYQRFCARFSGDGGPMTLNEKDGCWEYLCPGKGKIVVWLAPDDEEECVFLNVRFLDVNGKLLSRKENNAHIANTMVFDSMGMIILDFAPTRSPLMMALPYDDWTRLIRPEQIAGSPGLIFFAANSFDVNYLLIPERPEFFPREERKTTSEKDEIDKKIDDFITQMKEQDKIIEQDARENIQRANEEWEEWERRQADENESDRGE